MCQPPPASSRAERRELLQEQDLLLDLMALLQACPDLPLASLFDTAVALQDDLRGASLGRAAQ